MAQFKTGTVTVTNGSTAVAGVDMLWLANISVGDWFIRKGDDVSYQVASITDDTNLVLASAYQGVTASGVTYSVTTDFTANFNIPLLARGDIDTATVFARAMAEIDRLLGQNSGEWIDFNQTPTFVDADTFTFVGDQTDEHHVDRRIRIQDSVELYGTITSSVFTTLTTIDVRLDTGSITSAISAVAVGVASADGRQSISGSGIKSGTLEVNTINEDTAGAGVTIDGVLLKDGGATLTGNVLMGASILFIGDTTNANMTTGLTINQGANDDNIFELKSSDIVHGLVQIAETDSFMRTRKASATLGGMQLDVVAEDGSLNSPFELRTFGGTATTSKSSSAVALFQISVFEHDGSNGIADITANGNVFVVRGRVGGASRALFLVDEDGDLLADGGVASTDMVTLFDAEDDVALCRAFDLSRAEKGGAGAQLVKTEWDEWARKYQLRLVELGVLGADGPNGATGLVNVTQLQRLHNGAIVQLGAETRRLDERDHVICEVIDREVLSGFVAKVNEALEAANQRPMLLPN